MADQRHGTDRVIAAVIADDLPQEPREQLRICLLYTSRYMNQLAILTDLLDANSVRLDVELQLTAARTRVVYTYYQLLRACGRL